MSKLLAKVGFWLIQTLITVLLMLSVFYALVGLRLVIAFGHRSCAAMLFDF